MLVQPKDDPEPDEYLPLSKHIQYRVLAISADLSNQTRTWALIYDPQTEWTDTGVKFPWFVPFSELTIIEPDIPKEWKTAVFTENINVPTLVHSFAEMLDQDCFIRVHDLDADGADHNTLRAHLIKYGGNVYLGDD